MQGIVDNSTSSQKSQTATRPILIFCSTNKGEIGKNILELFDIILNIEGDQLKKTLPKEDADYNDWYEQLNHYELDRYGLGQKFYLK